MPGGCHSNRAFNCLLPLGLFCSGRFIFILFTLVAILFVLFLEKYVFGRQSFRCHEFFFVLFLGGGGGMESLKSYVTLRYYLYYVFFFYSVRQVWDANKLFILVIRLTTRVKLIIFFCLEGFVFLNFIVYQGLFFNQVY